jgi:hypothetical protein
MRLIEVINESLHDVLEILRSDAEQLARGDREHIGVIELKEDWEEEIPRLAHRYEKEIQRVYNSFNDPYGDDESEWTDAHYRVTMNFLIRHKLAKLSSIQF